MHNQSSDSLEDSRLLNQQKPYGGWFSDASSTSATESFPSYSRPPPILSLSLSLILYSSLYLFTRLYPSPPPSHTTTLLRLVRDNDSEATPYSREYTRIGGGWLVLFPGWRVSRS